MSKRDDKQSIFIESLEGLGDILAFQASRKRNKDVLIGLKRISSLMERLFELQESNPDEFDKIMYSKELLELYKSNKDEVGWQVNYEPQKNLPAFYTGVNQISRIFEAALAVDNTEVTTQCVYDLDSFLIYLSSKPSNNIFIEQILRMMTALSSQAIIANDISQYAAAIDWYRACVMDDFRTDRKFRVEYLQLFNNYYSRMIKKLIDDGNNQLFEHSLSSVIDTVYQTYKMGDVWKLDDHLMLNLETYRQLDETFRIHEKSQYLANNTDFDSVESYEHWLTKLDELVKIIKQNSPNDKLNDINKIVNEIKKGATETLKHNVLIELYFDFGTYAVSDKKYPFLLQLWQYNQPPDADASYVSENIYPDSPQAIINFYFKKTERERRVNFWRGHRGSELHNRKYFLLTLAYNLKRTSGEETLNLPAIDEIRLNDLSTTLEELKNMSVSLASDTSMLADLQLPTDIFATKIPIILQMLKEQANTRIDSVIRNAPMSPIMIKKFKDEALNGFEESANLYPIFKKFNSIRNAELPDESYVYTNILFARDTFFLKWFTHFGSVPSQIGSDIADKLDSTLLKKLIEHSAELPITELESKTLAFTKPVILVFGVYRFHETFEQLENYVPFWQIKNAQKFSGFAGVMKYGRKLAPVVRINYDGDEEGAILVDLGDANLKLLVNTYFDVDVKDTKDNLELIEPHLANLEGEAREAKKKELLKKVVINAATKMTVTFHDDTAIHNLQF